MNWHAGYRPLLHKTSLFILKRVKEACDEDSTIWMVALDRHHPLLHVSVFAALRTCNDAPLLGRRISYDGNPVCLYWSYFFVCLWAIANPFRLAVRSNWRQTSSSDVGGHVSHRSGPPSFCKGVLACPTEQVVHGNRLRHSL